MKRLAMAICAALFCVSGAASAVDVTANMVVLNKGGKVFEQTSVFVGMTAAEEQSLNKRGMKTVDFASKHQDKGGPYTIQWTWTIKDDAGKVTVTPTIETQGLTFASVNKILRMGVKWLGDTVTESEGRQAKGSNKPWGK
jgi:hypothetical protein